MTDQDERNRATREIMRAIAMGPMGPRLTVVDDEGNRPLLVALEHERLSAVLHRASWSGGFANVFVIFPGQAYRRFAVISSGSALLEKDAEHFPEGAIGEDTTVGMFMDLLRSQPAGVVVPVRMPGTAADVAPVEDPELITA